MLALATHNKRANDYVSVVELKAPPTIRQMFELGEVCGRVDNHICASHFIEKLRSTEALDDSEIAGIGRLYVFNHQYAEGYKYINDFRQLRSTAAIEEAWVLLAAATGKQYEVESWLKQAGPKDVNLLRDLYYLSSDNQYYNVTAAVGEALKKQQDTPETERLLALVYVKIGRYEEALPTLRNNRKLSSEDKSAYIIALGKLSENNDKLRTELNDFVAVELQNPRNSQKEKEEIIYTLINAGSINQVMPFVRAYALSQGGSWAALYQEQLIKQHDTQGLHSFLTELAGKPFISDSDKRNIAYALLDQGYRDEATGLFKTLAEHTSSPDNENVKTLLYLWGPRPTPDQLAWIANRAATANPKDQQKWVTVLNDMSGHDQIVELVETHRGLLQNPDVATIYLEALAQNTDHEELRKQIAILTLDQKNPDVLNRFARVALNHYEPRTARSIYEKSLQTRPDDAEALLNLGILSFGQSDFTTSKLMLGQYMTQRSGTNLPRNDYEAPYYYGEILRREKDKGYAEYYKSALDLIAPLQPKTTEILSMEAASRYYSGDKQGGLNAFRTAINEHPSDRVLKDDYVNLLVDNKLYDTARDAINEPSAGPDETALAMPWEVAAIDTRDIKQYAISPNQREVLIKTTRPAEPLVKRLKLEKDSPVTGYTSTGYDTILFSAAENNVLGIESSGERLHIVSTPAQAKLEPKLLEQVTIREELLRARIDLESGKQSAAVDRMNALSKRYPNDAQVLGFSANAQYASGNWRRAQSLIDKAKGISPENEDIAVLDRDMRRQHAPNVKIDYEWRSQGDNNEHIVGVSGFAYAKSYLQVGVNLLSDWVHGKNVRRADGRLGNFTDTKQQGEVFVGHDFENGSNLTGSIFGNNDTVGVGGEYSFLNPLGRTGVTAEYHRPYWEYTEGVLDDATRDRLSVAHSMDLVDNWAVSADTGFNRYNVKSESDVASSYSLTASIVKRLREGRDYSISAGYNLDAEYLIDGEKRIDAGGNSYRMFPLVSREVHSLDLSGHYDFSDRFYADALIGYSIDRLGGNGPIAEGTLTYLIAESLEAQIRAMHMQGYGAVKGNIDRVGGYLMMKY